MTMNYAALLSRPLPAYQGAVKFTEPFMKRLPLDWRIKIPKEKIPGRVILDELSMARLADAFRQFAGEMAADHNVCMLSKALYNDPYQNTLNDGIFYLCQQMLQDVASKCPKQIKSCLRLLYFPVTGGKEVYWEVVDLDHNDYTSSMRVKCCVWGEQHPWECDEHLKDAESLAGSGGPFVMDVVLPAHQHVLSRAVFDSLSKDASPFTFISSFKKTMLCELNPGKRSAFGPFISCSSVAEAGKQSSIHVIPAVMGVIMLRCARAGLVKDYPGCSAAPSRYLTPCINGSNIPLVPWPKGTNPVPGPQNRAPPKSHVGNQLPSASGRVQFSFSQNPFDIQNTHILKWEKGTHEFSIDVEAIVCYRELGFGNLGRVYEGRTNTGERVAVKIVTAMWTKREKLRHEWMMYCALSNTGLQGKYIPKCYGFLESGDASDLLGFSALVLEAIGDGNPLDKSLRYSSLKDKKAVWGILELMHDKGYSLICIHNNNVVRGLDEKLRVLDLQRMQEHSCGHSNRDGCRYLDNLWYELGWDEDEDGPEIQLEASSEAANKSGAKDLVSRGV